LPGTLASVQSADVLTVGPLAGDAPRILSYAAFPSGDRTVVLRVSTAVPELVEDRREGQQLLAGHGIALLLLALAAGLVLFPSRAAPPAPAPQALHAYEEAMERLRSRGEEISLRHQAERQRLEDDLRDKEPLARAGELTAGIVHEVRNGLGTILGYARLIERSASAEDVRSAAARIREECETLETVVRRFMDFVRRESLTLAPFDLARMLARLVARESQARPGPRVELTLPGEDEIVGDEELLERAFENLVRNACEAAGQEGRVQVQLAVEAGARVITVADDGPGLPQSTRDQLRPFFTTKPGGLGLGLPIALKIIRLHKGDLSFRPAHPRGLVVRVRLEDSPWEEGDSLREVSAGRRAAGTERTG
jgi:signal transduction histidine kinase